MGKLGYTILWQNKTSCGARHNKPRPLLPPSEQTYQLPWTKSAATKRLQTRCPNPLAVILITNKLTFDPPTRLPELTQNVIRSSHGHSTPSLKISCKSVQPFSRNVADKETKKQTKKERNRPKTIPRPPTGGGVMNCKVNFCCYPVEKLLWSSASVCVCVGVSVCLPTRNCMPQCPAATAICHINLCGEGNALYPVLSSCICDWCNVAGAVRAGGQSEHVWNKQVTDDAAVH